MKVRQPLALAFTMLLLTGGIAGLGGAGASSQGASAAMAPRAMDANEIEWGDDVALTDNPVSDEHPQLAVSADGASGVIWCRGGVTSDMMWMKLNSTGQALVPEKVLASSGLPVQESGFLPPCIGVDSKGSYALVAGPGGFGVYYSKLDSNGNSLVDWKSVPSGAVDPRNPALAVSSNDIVHIIYEVSPMGADQNALVYARLLNDGTVDKDGIRMSEASVNCTGSTICTDAMNQVHAAFIDLNGAVYHGMLDNFGNPLPQAPNAFIYTLKQSSAMGPPSICCGKTGAVWVLWNDKPQSTGVLRVMKLDNYGNILSGGPDNDGIPLTDFQTCIGFPSIATDSAGNIYAVWSDDRNGSTQLYYLRIEPGTENDSALPENAMCITNNTGSSALEPNLAIGSDDNLRIVWKDNRNGNLEIYYKLGLNLRSRAEVGLTPEQMARLLFVQPNQTVTANITVGNLGNMADTFNLRMVTDFHGHLGWNVSIGCASFLLGPKASIKVTVTVSSPLAGFMNDYIDTFLTAVPVSNPLFSSSLSIRTYLDTGQESFLLDCAEQSLSVPAGEQAVYSMRATSVGGQDVELNLTAEGPAYWICELSPPDIKVEASRSLNFTLSVTPPLDASGGDGAWVTVTARSAVTPADYKTIRTVTTVSSYLSLEVLPDPAVGLVDPGGNASFNLTVQDDGNIYEPLQFAANADWGNYSWDVALDEPNLSLRAGGFGVLVLNVTAPADALAGASLDINVTVTNFERDVSAWCDITALVRAVGSIDASVSPGCSTAEPGGIARFSIDISNRANRREEVRPADFVLPPGWNISFSMLDGSVMDGNSTVALDVGGDTSILVAVHIPAGTLAGWYPVAGTLVDAAGRTTPIVLNAAVEQRFILGLEAAAPAQNGTLDAELLFPLVVTNLGNGNDTIGFDVVDLPKDWPQPELLLPDGRQAIIFTLEPSKSMNVTALFRIPADTPVNSATIALYAESQGGIGFGTNLTIYVRKADLVIAGVEIASRDFRTGAPVQVNVTVANIGEAPARGVVLAYFLNDRQVTSTTDSALQAGEKRVEKFVWVPREGRNALSFVADPGNAVCESNETNNAASFVKDVQPGSGPAAGNDLFVVAAATVVLVLVGLVWLARRRGRPGRRSVSVAHIEYTND